MKKSTWFIPKKYGYGFTPNTWQGWLVTLLFVLVLLVAAYVNGIFSDVVTLTDGLRFCLDVLILAGLFTLLLQDRLDGDLGWRWGNKEKDKV